MEELDRSLPPLALPAAQDLDAGAGTALLLGQYLADLGILSAEEEVTLHRRMIEKAKDRGIRHCVFKPHPSAGPGAVRSVEAAARELGVQLDILESSAPAEVVMQRLQPQLVVSCFSTALMTAKYLFTIDAAAVGTALLLERLSPYENSNRVPVTIVDAVLERDVQAPDQEAAETPPPGGCSRWSRPSPIACRQIRWRPSVPARKPTCTTSRTDPRCATSSGGG